VTKGTQTVGQYFTGRGCTFRVDEAPQCLLIGSSRCWRPCSYYVRHDPRLTAKLSAATYVTARQRTITDHVMALLAFLVSFAALVISLLRFGTGR
jgi:hypothetical protein